MRASLAGNAVNLALDATLILGLGWGVQGAAIAAICGNLTELSLLAWPMRSNLRGLRWRRAAVREVWAQGVPNGLQFVMEVGSFLICQRGRRSDHPPCDVAGRVSRHRHGRGPDFSRAPGLQ